MISSKLIKPASIVVVGGSENTFKPGGKLLSNLIKGGFNNLSVINPGSDYVQGIRSYPDFESAPIADLAILAIPAKLCFHAVKALTARGVEAFIIVSAGFSEFDKDGKKTEEEIARFASENNISILGPNCIGIINEYYKGVFTLPLPEFNPKGIDFFSSSGSVAVFTIEAGMKIGMQFAAIYSVGNAACIKIEDLLEYHDHNYDPEKNSAILMIYIEQISDADKFIRHCRSLINKGCRIIGVKSGNTDAGMRAASSHTGALASPGMFTNAVFRKAGIIQCESRQEMLTVAGVLFYGAPVGSNVAVITHAGGSGVMAADALEKNGMKVPEISGNTADQLLSILHAGSSVSNPIDFLATGTAEQLGTIIDFCNDRFDNIDEIIVIFGSPGLFDVAPVYELLSKKIDNSTKPIYPVLPSPINTEEATKNFTENNKLFFADEVTLAKAIAKIYNTTPLFEYDPVNRLRIDQSISSILKSNKGKFLKPEDVSKILGYAGIKTVPEYIAYSESEIKDIVNKLGFPVVLKAVGPLHKSDTGGVILNIATLDAAIDSFRKIMKLPETKACLVQPMIRGIELFAGAKRDDIAGHLIMFGMGGVDLEIMQDTKSSLAPLSEKEVNYMIKHLKSYPILKGYRGKKGIDTGQFSKIIIRLSNMLEVIPEISEIDLNPLIANEKGIYAVDCRIRID